ncbi:S41 family peptidase [Ideonella sp. BN130291]|uniref:S41 family peptidase n=1 Tax=Ideonella sp. BN130291 TaxID=3112940 RepID=UPI002E26B775|nr:S41 family peptidase [Ideonella sp. BN130291]
MKHLLRLSSLAIVLSITQCAALAQATVDAATRRQVVDAAIARMKERYVFPDVAKKVEAALQRQWQAKAFDGLDDPKAFADKLTTELQAVTRDKHIRVRYSAQPLPPRTSDTPSAEELANDRREEQLHNYGVERVERLQGNIGYIDLRSFAPTDWAGETLAAAMTLVANTDALIVDLRKNGGGDPSTVAFVTSYLFDTRTHLNSLYWREGDRTEQFHTHDWVPGKRFGQKKPVYVLTSSRTFSGAEEFSYNLKNLKRATLVGETTGGGANPGDVVPLNGHFGMFVPTGRAVSPITKTNWEGTGVEPDVKVAADQALDVARRMALEKVIATETDAERKGSLQELLATWQKDTSAR